MKKSKNITKKTSSRQTSNRKTQSKHKTSSRQTSNRKTQSKQKTERVEASYPHFRYYKKSKHPALILGEQKGKRKDDEGNERETDEYRYRKVMHGGKEGGRNNETIFPNPNPKDSKPMQIAKRVRHDEKENFEKTPLPWKYPKK